MAPSSRRRRTSVKPPDAEGSAGRTAGPPEHDPDSTARGIVLRLLTGAPRSRHQLAASLARREVPEDVAERVLDRFTEVGLIDDAEYARMLVRSQRESRGLARRALAVELRRKGIDPELAREALATVDDAAEERSARDLVRRRWRSGPGVDAVVQSRRALGMLARKGYPPGLSSRLVREMVDDSGSEPWEPAVDTIE